ncbi:aldolase/citrate lyase family protein [Holdemania massiliensis]|uniref:aldolase/citrate lyase family protein n=1 Tax=Holdemania massiliensis TaxID=1468449 RepID=UPI001F06D178|nr:aldolase/citrate lyase family protein [Holdemania massiliensis]MCH1941244.1 aldolase/citrate lyase family protein [Holdemania massiliensis]
MFLKLMYITNDLSIALIAQKYGIDRIWIDLETLGKEARQKGQDSVKSHHKVSDISKIAPYLETSEMLVRINPWNANSVYEINSVIKAGADIIMLPYWKTVREVELFIKTLNRRCKSMLLLETKEAEACLDEVLEIEGIDEIHIGLNDLHLSHNLSFMFELLMNGTVENLCEKIKSKGLPYGFGGIARLGCGELPAENIIKEHYRLGSTRAILSRSFCNVADYSSLSEIDSLFRKEITKIREYEALVSKLSSFDLMDNQLQVKEIVDKIVKKKTEVIIS